MEKRFRITDGQYRPEGRWDSYSGLMDYEHCALVVAKKIARASKEQLAVLQKIGFTVWDKQFPVVSFSQGEAKLVARTGAQANNSSEYGYIKGAIESALKETS